MRRLLSILILVGALALVPHARAQGPVIFNGPCAPGSASTTATNGVSVTCIDVGGGVYRWVGGGGGSPTAVDGVIYAKDPAFGGKFDVRYESDCTFNTTTTIVCPSGHFTSADVGKIEFGTNALQQHGAGTVNAT